MLRLFTAIPIPEDIKSHITAQYGTLEQGRWVPEDNLHITLVFIGDYPTEQLDVLCNLLKNIVFNPLTLQIKGCGTFKNGQLWLGVEENPGLNRLYQEVSTRLQELDISLEKRKFLPHVTIARSKKRKFDPYTFTLQAFRSREFEIDHFNLYLSTLKQTGAEYEIIDL